MLQGHRERHNRSQMVLLSTDRVFHCCASSSKAVSTGFELNDLLWQPCEQSFIEACSNRYADSR